MVDFPTGTPALPDILVNDPPGSAAGGVGLRTLINRANDNILTIINEFYNGPIIDNNPILNGGLSIWADGTTFTGIANGAYGPDCWQYTKVGAVVHDLLQSSDVPAVSAIAVLGGTSLHLDVTTVDAAIAAGDLCGIIYRMEGYYFRNIAQRQFTIRFWVKAAKTGIHCVSFRNSGLDRSYVAEYTIIAADTWEEKTITVSASPSAGTWDYTTGLGLAITFALSAGSTFQTTAGSWQTGSFLATANQVNETDSTANNFKIFGLTCRPGPYCPPFAYRPYALEDYLCRRYNEVLGGVATSLIANGHVATVSAADFRIPLAPKRGTISAAALASIANVGIISAAGAVVANSISIIGGDKETSYFRFGSAAASLVVGNAAMLYMITTDKLAFRSRF